MAEANLRAELDQARVGRRRRRRRRRGRALGRRHSSAGRRSARPRRQQQQPRVRRKRLEPLRKLSSIRPASAGAPGSPKPPARSAGVSPRGSSSSASGLPRVSATIRSRTRASSGPGITESSSARARRRPAPRAELRQAAEALLAGALANGEDQPDRLGLQSARHEREHLRGRLSSHCASSTRQSSGCSSAASDSRLSTASPTRKRSGRVAGAQAERGRERVALRAGQPLEAVEQRRAELMKPRERELHLGLDSRRADDAAARTRAATRYSSSAVFPTPASPRSTSAALRPACMVASS